MIGFIDTAMMMFSTLLKQNLGDYCELETNLISGDALVGKDGSLMSLIIIDGNNSVMGAEEYKRAMSQIRQAVSVIFTNPGHTVQSGFFYDPFAVAGEIGKSLDKSRTTASNLNMDLEDLLDERQTHLASFCASEMSIVAVWTHPSVVSSAEFKRINAAKARDAKKAPPPAVPDAQSFNSEISEIVPRHRSAVESLVNELNVIGINMRVLKPHDAVATLRRIIDPHQTSENWRPVLMGDKIPARIGQKLRFKSDMSSIAYPPLYEQLMPRSAERLDNQIMKMGNRLYLPMFVDLMPQDVQRFASLFSRMINAGMPWMFNMQLGGEGMKVVSGKAALSAFIAFASTKNKQIDLAVKGLRDYLLNNGTVASVRICLATWVDGEDNLDNRDLLKSRGNTLTRAIQNWGQCEVSEMTGDPIEGYFSAIPGYTSKNIGNPSVAPVKELVEMMPLFRPGSPWSEGAVAFRTPDGKLFPFQPGSSLQSTWINLIFAPPGRGKSVLLNMMNLALCLAPGNRELPYIHIIDIGPSSSGLISLAQGSLPEKDKHLFAHHRLKMEREYSVNQFDLQLGMQRPLPLERSYLINFLLVLLTPPGEKNVYEGMSGLVTQVIDDVYKMLSVSEQPKKYTERVNRAVDDTIRDIGMEIDSKTSWYEVTDALHDAGRHHEAMLAQRYAVPILPDLVSASRTPQMVDVFGKIIAPTGESIIDVFSRMISEAVKNYPILAEPTQFDLGDARVVSIDLDEVAKGVGVAAEKQTTVMYMLARNMARHFYLNETDVPLFPAKYRAYQERRIMGIRNAKKHLAYDEFHRTKGAGDQSVAIQQQVIIDMREGRKWDVIVSLLSQSIKDFHEEMVNFATGIFVLGAGSSQKNVASIADTFGLNDTAKQIISGRLNGPSSKGSNVFAIFDTKRGVYSQLLTSTIGPQELWAYSTTNEDAAIRNRLYKRIGAREARRILARLFPGGTAKPEVERRMMEVMETDHQVSSEDASLSIAEQMVDEIEKRYLKDKG